MDSLQSFITQYTEFLSTNWLEVVIIFAILIIFLGSGCISGSIAEERMRNIAGHFILGFIVPIIYPILIYMKLSVHSKEEARGRKVLDFEQVEGAPPVETPPPAMVENAPPALLDSRMLDKPVVVFDQAYFKKVAVDMSGNYRGPFLLTVNGEKLKTERIIDSLPEVVLIEFLSADGKMQNMRIPYKNIEGCQEL